MIVAGSCGLEGGGCGSEVGWMLVNLDEYRYGWGLGWMRYHDTIQAMYYIISYRESISTSIRGFSGDDFSTIIVVGRQRHS